MPGIRRLDGEAASISLVTSAYNGRAQYHLMELTPDLVHYFEAGPSSGTKRRREGDEEGEGPNRLCIKGRQSDEAVLCTANQTFTMREMTQSNSLLLCTLGQAGSECVAQVRSNVAEIWELTPVVARTGRISQLLKDSLYYGDGEDEREGGRKRYTPQQVASIVQASAKELQEGIEKSHAILLDGYYRMIAPVYLMEALQVLLNYIDVQDHIYEQVPIGPTLAALQEQHGTRRELTEAILLRWFGKEKEDADTERVVELKVDVIVRFIGLQLLESTAQKTAINVDEFLVEWEKAVGPNLSGQIKVELLKGHFITFPAPPTQPSDSNPTTIQHFTSSDLPLEPSSRLQQLFQKREQWTLEELSPFLDDIAIDAKKRDAILLKYARTTSVKVALPETKKDRKTRLRRGEMAGPSKDLKLYSARLRH